jgi:hypothetical protein
MPEDIYCNPTRRTFVKYAALSALAANLPDINPLSATILSSPRRTELLQSGWRFKKESLKQSESLEPSEPTFNDGAWEIVGVPHCFNDLDTFQNAANSQTFRGNVWYRSRFRLAPSARGKKVFVEFEAVNIACAVYVNGKFKPGNTQVPQPGQVTHIGCFLPFAIDITDDVHFGSDNVLAIRVSNLTEAKGGASPDSTAANPQDPSSTEAGKEQAYQLFHTDPGFGTFLNFGMGFGGIVGAVRLHIVDRIHIPLNVYSPMQKWGTYVGTITATEDTAQIRIQTNVENEDHAARNVQLTTRIVDAENSVVSTLKREMKHVPAGETHLFDQTVTLERPYLWYPSCSPFGKPYLYRVISDVAIDGKVVDTAETPLGIRVVTWDDDYCYINGKKHLLNGFGLRNIYPALGSAIPVEIQWNDIRLIAECGGNLLRVGHVPAMRETVSACDAYGVLVMQESGDNEWSLNGEPNCTYKREYDRDCIIAFRNHPSIAMWESNNGLAIKRKPVRSPVYSPRSTMELVDQWDYLHRRIVVSRDTSDYWPADRKIMIGYTNAYQKVKGSPSLNLEVYGAKWGKGERSYGIGRFDYENEKTFADYYVNDYFSNLDRQACGWVAWMLAETQGESYVTYLNGKSKQKSLGSCAMDGNRFPKLTYQIFKNALWVPFSIRPGVALQSHWNLSGIQDVVAWSNCPKVELFLNGVSLGVRLPDRTKRCNWDGIDWQAGTLKAVGYDGQGRIVCLDTRQTAGPPHRIVLSVGPGLVKPNGEAFRVRANGSDAVIVTAMVVDAAGIWCPLADNNIRFEVDGSGSYRGSYNFYVADDKPLTYHAPGDHELQAEGGLMRVAVRTTFKPGKVNVTATSPGLGTGRTSFVVERE